MLYVLLVPLGLFGGFIGGMIGIGGGIIFAPALLAYFHAIGVPDAHITQLTLGSSLLSVLIASISSAWSQHKKKAVLWDVTLVTGGVSAVVALAATEWISTQSWYDKKDFQLVFALVLLLVVVRMMTGRQAEEESRPIRRSGVLMTLTGMVSGMVSALTGVGGGTILVPAYNRWMHIPLKMATGTSVGTIIITSGIAMLGYMWQGQNVPLLPTSFGYVDWAGSCLLAIPALISAGWGVEVAHRINTNWLKRIFALFCTAICFWLIWSALAG